MTTFSAGPRCADHHEQDARNCPDCWHEAIIGLRPDNLIGKHYEATHEVASVVSKGAK